MSETPVDSKPPVSRIRIIILGFLALATLLTFVVPWVVPMTPSPFYLMVVVLFGPPLLPVRFLYKVLVLLGLLVVGPFLLPLRPFPNTSPARELATPESRFFDTGQIEIHYQSAGTGEPVLMLLHAGQPIGLGTWYRVLPALSATSSVVAFDRPGAGLTEWPGQGWESDTSPYSSQAQADQTVALMDHLGVREAVLVGNSSGGTMALLAALRHPERVSGLVLISPGVYFGQNDGSPAWIRRLLGTPQGFRIQRLRVRASNLPRQMFWPLFWHDPAKETPEDKESYLRTFQVQQWDHALVEIFRTARPLGLPERLREVEIPVLVITGDEDKLVPMEYNERLVRELPDARLEVVADCGHLPQQEQPEAFLRLVQSFVRELDAAD